MKKRIIITAVVFAAIHFVLATGSVLIAFTSGMAEFDNLDYQPSIVENLADHTAAILMQPGISLWTPWMSKNMPDVVEWGLCLANSLLWGVTISLLLNILIRKNRQSIEAIVTTPVE
jgi:membrane protease YdiL (CAAX protease family)